MLTDLGKELRKVRLDLGITLFDMASEAGISTAMLSSIETGKKAAPEGFVDQLARLYPLVKARKAEFQRLADRTKKEVRLQLDTREDATELAVAFARNFKQLSDDQIKDMMAVFGKKK